MKKITLFLLSVLCSAYQLSAQFQGSLVGTAESTCLSNGSATIKGPSGNLYALTSPNTPQIGPLSPNANGVVLFDAIPAGTYTVTEFTPDNQENTLSVTVPGNYFQNWIFNAEVVYSACSGGTPTINIGNLNITSATGAQLRPPYMFRISPIGGGLPANGGGAPPYQNTTSFPIPFPSGTGGTYELQAIDACGNYKTIQVNVPASAPPPSVSANFQNFANCGGDANYTLSGSGGTPPYTVTVVSGPNQVGNTVSNVTTQNYTFSANGTYVVSVTDQCGGQQLQTINVKPYQAPTSTIAGNGGSCGKAGTTGTGSIIINTVADGIGPITVTITSDCGAGPFVFNNVGSSLAVDNLPRPCNYTAEVVDGCGKSQKLQYAMVVPAENSLGKDKQVLCSNTGSTDYVLQYSATNGPPYSPTPPFTFDVQSAVTNTSIAGYPTTQNGYTINQPLPPGTYYLKITDACKATTYDTIKIELDELPTVSVNTNNPCVGAGQVNLIGINKDPLNPNTYRYKIVAGPTRVGDFAESDSPNNTGQFSSLQSGGTYTFEFFDGCKTANVTFTIPEYTQPSWEIGYGALCPPKTASNLQIINIQPAGQIVGPYVWRIDAEDSDLFTSPLPFPNSVGQTDSLFANLPPKNSSGGVATYSFKGNDACKNSYSATGKVGPIPDETLIFNLTSVCEGDKSKIRARVSSPIVGGTYRFYRDGILVAQSNKLFTDIIPALPGNYTVKSIASALPDSSCFKESSAVAVVYAGKIDGLTPSACNTTTNTYDLAGTFTFTSAASSGTVTFTVAGEGSQVINAPFSSPLNFNITGLSGDGASRTVVATFSADANCTYSATYTTPICCIKPTPPALSVVNNSCAPIAPGAFSITTPCGAGTYIEYSENGGTSWTQTPPYYAPTAKTVLSRCVRTGQVSCFSNNSAAVSTSPTTCPPPPPAAPCNLAVTQQIQSVCNNNGTINSTQDDYFTVIINAASVASTSSRFEVAFMANADGTGGNPLGASAYGTPISVGSWGNLVANNTAITLTVRDISIGNCYKTIQLLPVAPCSINRAVDGTPGCPKVPCAPIFAKKN